MIAPFLRQKTLPDHVYLASWQDLPMASTIFTITSHILLSVPDRALRAQAIPFVFLNFERQASLAVNYDFKHWDAMKHCPARDKFPYFDCGVWFL
jgi:hypothetical protein